MKRHAIIVGSIIVVLAIAGGTFYVFGGVEKVKNLFQPKNQSQTINVTGKVVCLPRKDSSNPSTLVCAVGMQATNGKYYGMSGSKNTELSDAAGSDKTVTIKGRLDPPTDDSYKMEGIIAIDSYTLSN